jgi:hypothetical protein
MVSEVFIGLFSGMAASIGITPAAMSILFSIIFSCFLGLAIMIFYSEKIDHPETMGLVIFYGILGVLTFLGAFDWLPYGLILVISIIIYKATNEGGQ